MVVKLGKEDMTVLWVRSIQTCKQRDFKNNILEMQFKYFVCQLILSELITPNYSN